MAFGVAHTAHLAATDPAYLGTLRQSVERRHAALQDTAGLNAEVFDSLVLLAAGLMAAGRDPPRLAVRPRPPGQDGRGPPQAPRRHRLPRRRGRRTLRPAHPQLHVAAADLQVGNITRSGD